MAAQLAVGAVLGLVTAIMLGRTFRVDVSRGVALGMTLIATGLSVRVGVSPVAVLFTMGLTVASLSPLGSRIRRRLRSERFALLPVLLFAGALATFQGWVAGVAMAVVVTRLAFGPGLGALALAAVAVNELVGPVLFKAGPGPLRRDPRQRRGGGGGEGAGGRLMSCGLPIRRDPGAHEFVGAATNLDPAEVLRHDGARPLPTLPQLRKFLHTHPAPDPGQTLPVGVKHWSPVQQLLDSVHVAPGETHVAGSHVPLAVLQTRGAQHCESEVQAPH